jgi:hypothetical protein
MAFMGSYFFVLLIQNIFEVQTVFFVFRFFIRVEW